MSQSANQGDSSPRIIIDRHRDGETERTVSGMHSYTDNWYGLMAVVFRLQENTTMNDTAGSPHIVGSNSSSGIAIFADSSVETRLAIGDSGADFDQNNDNLGNALQTSSVSSRAREDNNQLIRISASFSISSSQTIRETGIQLDGLADDDTNRFTSLIERTVLDSEVPVVDGDTVSVTYENTWVAP